MPEIAKAPTKLNDLFIMMTYMLIRYVLIRYVLIRTSVPHLNLNEKGSIALIKRIDDVLIDHRISVIMTLKNINNKWGG